MIEQIVREHIEKAIDVPVYMEVPAKMPGTFITLEKTGSGRTNHIDAATFAVQSWAESLQAAAELNQQAKKAMDSLIEEAEIARSRLNSDYNFTDTSTKKYRYQAVYDLTYYEE